MKENQSKNGAPVDSDGLHHLKPAGPQQMNFDEVEIRKRAEKYLEIGVNVEEAYNRLMDLEFDRRSIAASIPASQREMFMELLRKISTEKYKQMVEEQSRQLDLETEINKINASS